MTIFSTPFRTIDKQCTGPSVDSGFTSVDDVVAVMGDDYVSRTPRLVIYGDDTNRVIFSDLSFGIDSVTNNN